MHTKRLLLPRSVTCVPLLKRKPRIKWSEIMADYETPEPLARRAKVTEVEIGQQPTVKNSRTFFCAAGIACRQ